MTGPADGRVVVITGASAGIGAETAELLAGRGMAVVLMARRAEALADVAGRCGPQALAVPGDATRRDEVRALVAAAIGMHGRIDVWINNVGQGITRPPSALTDDDIDAMMLVNVKSALYGMQEVLPHFQARGTGHIINISSMLGRIPYVPGRSTYSGAKHFLNALTASFREEIQSTHPGIQVSLVSPPVVRTGFGLNARHGGPDSRTLPRSQGADEVARVIAEVIDSRYPDVYTAPGSHARVIEYFSTQGRDSSVADPA